MKEIIRRWCVLILILASMAFLVPRATAQVTNVINDTMTPIEGGGHD
jgi:hypothetical protein